MIILSRRIEKKNISKILTTVSKIAKNCVFESKTYWHTKDIGTKTFIFNGIEIEPKNKIKKMN